MNLELWNAAVDWIEDHPEEYKQNEAGLELADIENFWGPKLCGSPCCFLGVVAMLNDVEAANEYDLKIQVAELLDIDIYDADNLFYVHWPRLWFHKAGFKTFGYAQPTASRAIAILRGMARDGSVW